MRSGIPFGSWSLAAAGAVILITQAFHPVILAALMAGQTAAWLAALTAGLMAMLWYWPVTMRLAALPGGNLISLARAAAGRPGAVGTGLLTAALLVSHSGFVLRETAEMTVTAAYPLTPMTFVVVALTVPTLYVAAGGTAAIVRLCRSLLPVLLLTILLLLVGTFGWGELRYLLPIWGPGPALVLQRSILLTPSLYAPALFMLIAAGQLRDRRHLGRAAAVAILVAALVFAATKVLLVMTFPYPFGATITFALHEMARLIVGGRFFERIEGMWILVWGFATVCHLGALLHAAAVAYADAFALPDHRVAVLPLVTLALTASLFASDQAQVVAWHRAVAPVGLLVAFVLPLVLTLLAAWRGVGG